VVATRAGKAKKRPPKKKVSSTSGTHKGSTASAPSASSTKTPRGAREQAARTPPSKSAREPDFIDRFVAGFNEASPTLKAVAGVAFTVGGVAVAVSVVKHNEAKEANASAKLAQEHAAAQEYAANTAQQYASEKHTEAAYHQQRADVAESRLRKLAKEMAYTAHKKIAELKKADVPPLYFNGCQIAATDGDCIRINMDWLLRGVVDEAVYGGDIWGRVVGVVAHEWYHYLDPARGQRAFHEEELAADRHAGKVLAELGEPPDCFAALLNAFPESSTHPRGKLRAEHMLAEYHRKRRALQGRAATE